jgi:pSer/pThr/pTyr-binding forkhead associated (FHA) protein
MNLQELEARLRSLVEIKLVSVLPGQKAEDLIVARLTDAMRSGVVKQADGKSIAPNAFRLFVEPAHLPDWNKPEIVATLHDVLITSGELDSLLFIDSPVVAISGDPKLAGGEFRWAATHRAEIVEETMDMKIDAGNEGDENETIPESAFLIVEGVKVFPLVQAVVNLGRRLDNTLVIDDPRISRNHAQLRAIKGRFVIFDLNSTGGTFVNGQRINQSVLYAGDVISLAGVALIFGQDNPPPRTDPPSPSPLNEAGANRSTVVLQTMPPTKKKKK